MSCCETTGLPVSEQSLRILVTEAHELAGLGAVRSLGRAGHRVVASFPDGNPRPPSTYSRYCSGFCTQPDPWSQQLAFRDWWLDQARSGDFDVLLPTTEASVAAASALRGTTRTRLLMASPKSLEFALSKHQTARAALEAGVPAPRTLFFGESGSGCDSTRDLRALRFPVILKSDNHLQPDGIYAKGRAMRAETPEAAEPLLESLLALPTRVIVQEWVPGRGVGAFFLRHAGRVRLRFAHRRLHEIPAAGGWSSLRESSTDLRVLEYGEKLLAAVNFEGVAMVEFRQAADGVPKLLEINGRLWGSLALALHAGVDFPKAWLDCATSGTPGVEQPRYPAGLVCRNHPGEVRRLRSLLQAESAIWPRARAWLGFAARGLDPRVRHDHWWWSDPGPGWAALRYAAREYRGWRPLRPARQPSSLT